MLTMKQEINITLVSVKTLYLLFGLCFLAVKAHASQMERYIGWLKIDGKEIAFSLNFRITKNNVISGTSLTAKGTKDETKCKIKGVYNKKNNSIFFYETVVLSSKATYENLNFCLLVGNLKRKETKKEIQYTGKIAGYVRGTKRICAQGRIHLLKKKTEKKVQKKSIQSNIGNNEVDTLISHIASKKIIIYPWKTKHLTLKFWDNIQADGDRIDIYLDGKKIVSNYELSQTKKSIPLVLDREEHILKIVALNEGKAAPNTSTFLLQSFDASRKIIAHIKKGEKIYIKLKK